MENRKISTLCSSASYFLLGQNINIKIQWLYDFKIFMQQRCNMIFLKTIFNINLTHNKLRTKNI